MNYCRTCHHPQTYHIAVYKHGREEPCLAMGCKCECFTLRPDTDGSVDYAPTGFVPETY